MKPTKILKLCLISAFLLSKLYADNVYQGINHVAFVPDGNRRWAKTHNLPIKEGHQKGFFQVTELVNHLFSAGINTVTIWCFSTENWKRDKQEINWLMDIYHEMLEKFAKIAHTYKAKIVHLGRKSKIPTDLLEKINKAEQLTKDYTEHVLFIGIDYGGRDELVRALQKMIIDKIDPSKVTEDLVSSYLDTNASKYPNPDLVIRPGKRSRLSGFLPWQSTYSEIIFSDVYCPDFDVEYLEKCLQDFKTKARTFGGN